MRKVVETKKDSNICHVLFYPLSFLLPGIIAIFAFLALGIAPFGGNSIAVSDASGYYVPFLSYCKSIFSGEHGILYSFSQDLGGGIAATVWPYLANPFSWIIAAFDYEQYSIAYSLGVLISHSLYGLSMYLLLHDIHGHKLGGLLLSTCYALSGFSVVFNINTAFFFGGPFCLPLMLLGLRKMFRGESPMLYIVSIAYSIVLHIQMGFAVCMASTLLFAAELYIRDFQTNRRMVFRFITCSAIGGLLSAIVWIPEVMILKDGRGELSLDDFQFVSNAPFLQFASRMFTGASSFNQISNGYPAIFCGILPVALVIIYFLDANVQKKRKTAYAVILCIYSLGFYIRTFTSIFQALTHANWFNYRFSFVFIFIVILISAEEMDVIGRINTALIKKCGMLILVSALVVFLINYEFINGGKVVLDLLLLSVMGGGLVFHKKSPERASEGTLVLLFCVCTFLQLYLNYYFCSKPVLAVFEDEQANYEESILKKQPLINAVKETDGGFYRVESEMKLHGGIGNDSLFLGYNGVGYAGHTERKFVSVGLGKLGIDFQSGCWNSYGAGVPAAADALLGLKYIISDRDLTSEKRYEKKIELLGNGLYTNPYALPAAILCNEEIMDVSISEENNVFKNLNEIWDGITGEDKELFIEEKQIEFSNHNPADVHHITYDAAMEEKASGRQPSGNAGIQADAKNRALNISADNQEEKGEGDNSVVMTNDKEIGDRDLSSGYENDKRYLPYIEFSFAARRTGPIYLYDSASIVKDIGSKEDVMQYVGYFNKGEKVTGRLYLSYTITEELMVATVQGLHICYAEMDLLESLSKTIRERVSSVEKESDSRLSGSFVSEPGQRLLFTVPYDRGWKLIVDGSEVALEKTADIFMSASVPLGKHDYELTFWPVGLAAGIFASIFGFLCFVIMVCTANLIRARDEKKNVVAAEIIKNGDIDESNKPGDKPTPPNDVVEEIKPREAQDY